MRGSGEIEVGGERLPLDADHLARVGPEAQRKVSPARTGSGCWSSAASRARSTRRRKSASWARRTRWRARGARGPPSLGCPPVLAGPAPSKPGQGGPGSAGSGGIAVRCGSARRARRPSRGCWGRGAGGGSGRRGRPAGRGGAGAHAAVAAALRRSAAPAPPSAGPQQPVGAGEAEGVAVVGQVDAEGERPGIPLCPTLPSRRIRSIARNHCSVRPAGAVRQWTPRPARRRGSRRCGRCRAGPRSPRRRRACARSRRP